MDNGMMNNAMPMKWHKFLIYFSLWVGAAMNVVDGVKQMTGMYYGEYAGEIYGMYGALKAVDILFGVIAIGMAVLTVKTRFALAKYQENGPKLLGVLYTANALVALGYVLVFCVATGVSVGEMLDSSTVSSIVGAFAMVAINRSYYEKRRELFVN